MNNKIYNIFECWLDPTGNPITDHKLFNFNNSYHTDLGYCIYFDLFKDKYNWTFKLQVFEHLHLTQNNDVVSELDKLGYIRLHSFRNQIKPVWIFNPKINYPNKKQLEYIENWCKINKVQIQDHLNIRL